MKSRTLFIVAVILLAVASLYPGAAMAQSAAEREITELEQKMNAAYAANDLPDVFRATTPRISRSGCRKGAPTFLSTRRCGLGSSRVAGPSSRTRFPICIYR